MKDSDPDRPIHIEASAADHSNVYQVGRGNLNVDASTHFHGTTKPTPAEEIVATRPLLWEYLLFAATLQQEMSSIQGKWIGYCYGYTIPAPRYTSEKSAIYRINQYLGDSLRIVESLNSMLDLGLQERAFGRPGEDGDAETINHLAHHICALLGQWLDSAVEMRSISIPSRLENLRRLTIQLSDKAIRDAHAFIKNAISELEGLPQRLASRHGDEPIIIEVKLCLTVDDSVRKQHNRELRKLGRLRS